jgi:hypothetical protein
MDPSVDTADPNTPLFPTETDLLSKADLDRLKPLRPEISPSTEIEEPETVAAQVLIVPDTKQEPFEDTVDPATTLS